ncbi:hypothetical protein RYX36_020533 [Vicia faba]
MRSMSMNPLLRGESFGYNNYFPDQNYTMMEKRHLFLRSYQFCRKKSLTERIKGSLVHAKKVVRLKLRQARGLRKLVFFPRFKCGFYYRRRRFFSQLLNSSSNSQKRKTDFPCLKFWPLYKAHVPCTVTLSTIYAYSSFSIGATYFFIGRTS